MVTPRTDQIGHYTVEVLPRGLARVTRGTRPIGQIHLVSATLKGVPGAQATSEQILHALVSDEDIFSGIKTRPEDHAAVFGPPVDTSADPAEPPSEMIYTLLRTEPDEYGWYRDSDVWAQSSGSTGKYGDAARGFGFDARYIKPHSDGTFLVVDVGFFVEDLHVNAVDDGEHEPDYGICCQIHFTHCTDSDDPGGTELSSEIRYRTCGAPYGHTLAYYEHECLRLALIDQRGADLDDETTEVLGLAD